MSLSNPATRQAESQYNEIPIEALREVFSYEPGTGCIWWRVAPRNGIEAGAPAFTCHIGRGYRQGSWKRIRLLAHRVAFALGHGRWPQGYVDHINGDTTDNRLHNLREATNAQNGANTTKGKHGYRGVTKVRNGLWRAHICIDGRNRSLGTFHRIEDAGLAYQRAVQAHYGEFAPVAAMPDDGRALVGVPSGKLGRKVRLRGGVA